MLDLQSKHVAELITEVERRDARSIEPTPEAEAEWVELMMKPNAMTKYQTVCTPGYYNAEGTNEGKGFLQTTYPDGALAFYDMLAQWREQGDFDGLIVR
jgi:cyclohexanone monooxygenase